MRYIELRRHTMRHKPGKNGHVTQEGVSLARRVGEGMGSFRRVITSEIPRAFETAIAMGYAVDEQSKVWSTYGDAVEIEIESCISMADLARVAANGKETVRFCRLLADHLEEIALDLKDGESALIVSHGGVIELACIACVPQADYGKWGDFFSYCEGARLTYKAGTFCAVKLLRV